MALKRYEVLGWPAFKRSESAVGLQNGPDGFKVSQTALKQANSFKTVMVSNPSIAYIRIYVFCMYCIFTTVRDINT